MSASRNIAAVARLGTLVLAFAWMAQGVAVASEESELLYSRGLVQFHAGAYDKALQLFEQALQADTEDVYALYYRGVTRGRLGDFEAAATDLRQVVEKDPELEQAYLELGVALTQTENYDEAAKVLEKAQAVGVLDAEASFFLALAQLRQDDLSAAQENFTRAQQKDFALAIPAQYYQGVIAYQSGEWEAAQEQFQAVVDGSPASEMGREAEAFLAKIGQGGDARPLAAFKPYSLFARTGFEYDSNINLGPDNDPQGLAGVSNKSDGRFTVMAGGRYSPWQSERMLFTVGYEFFQSLHFTESDFNLQDHRPLAEFSYNQGRFHVGLDTRYDYYLSGSIDSFLSQPTVFPWFSFDEPGFGRTEVFYRMRYQDYKQQSFNLLNGFNHSPGLRQVFFLGSPERQFTLGYRFDSQDTSKSKGDPYDYNGQEVSLGLNGDLPAEIRGQLWYAYRFEGYDSASKATSTSSNKKKRQDNVNQVVVSIERDFIDLLNLRLSYFGNFHGSNQSLFEYDRHIVSLTVGVSY